MSPEQTMALLERLDGTGSCDEREAIGQLHELGPALVPWLIGKYRKSRSWRARASCVHRALAYVGESEDAVALGREALHDKSAKVRFRACQLLAFAQRADVVPDLRRVLASLRGGAGSDDVRAAIDAIESHDQHHFIDRDHSGTMKMFTLDQFMEALEAGREPVSSRRVRATRRKRPRHE